ncbi:MAG: O-antigen ligase family protein [Flavobacteriales bacterium]|nr:O-antigen ligase family protein [Flavobacteriales bacterium]
MSGSGLLPGRDAFRTVHVGALALCAIMLPWSTALLSMAQMLLVANWLLEGIVRTDFIGRFRRTFTSGPSLVFLSIFGLHVLGLLWTSDLDWGTDLVRILLPILSVGAVLAGSPRLSVPEFRAVLLLGAWSVVASTFVCLVMRKGGAADYRSLSVFISHIRLTLLLCLAIVVLLLDRGGPLWLRIMGYCAVPWALFFINKLGSIQGFCILLVLVAVLLWRWVGGQGKAMRWIVRATVVALPVSALLIGLGEVRERYRLPDPELARTFEKSAGGEMYTHDIANPQMENGTHVWTWLAWREMRATWPLRSKRSIDDLNDKGNPIWGTLVRYLASKGERKDSVAVMALTDAEVRDIEQGIPNVLHGQRSALRERIDEVFFELEHYYAYGAADGHSVAMRLEFLKAGMAIAMREWTIGVGTGDTKTAFAEQYERMGTSLSVEWRHRAHNEYLTLWISFGVFGLLWSLFAFWWPARRLMAWNDPLFIAWSVILGISCFTDDTIETQAGATFFGLYYALFVFGAPRSVTTAPQE